MTVYLWFLKLDYTLQYNSVSVETIRDASILPQYLHLLPTQSLLKDPLCRTPDSEFLETPCGPSSPVRNLQSPHVPSSRLTAIPSSFLGPYHPNSDGLCRLPILLPWSVSPTP